MSASTDIASVGIIVDEQYSYPFESSDIRGRPPAWPVLYFRIVAVIEEQAPCPSLGQFMSDNVLYPT
jgi:hypothetical protein